MEINAEDILADFNSVLENLHDSDVEISAPKKKKIILPPYIPQEILVLIGTISPSSWGSMTAIRSFVDWTRTDHAKRIRSTMFTHIHSENFAFTKIENKLHCPDDQPAVWATNSRIYIAWFWKGLLHNNYGPAYIEYKLPRNPTSRKEIISNAKIGIPPPGKIITFLYVSRGLLHREDGPAAYAREHTMYYRHGRYVFDEEILYPVLAESDLIAAEYIESSNLPEDVKEMIVPGTEVKAKFARVFGKENIVLHCDNGPAYQYYDSIQIWAHAGNLHREDGPAVLCGRTKIYYFHGKIVTKRELKSITVLNKFPLPGRMLIYFPSIQKKSNRAKDSPDDILVHKEDEIYRVIYSVLSITRIVPRRRFNVFI